MRRPWIAPTRTPVPKRIKPRAQSKRAAIIDALREGPKTSAELCAASGMAFSAIGGTLGALQRKRLIISRRLKPAATSTRLYALATATRRAA